MRRAVLLLFVGCIHVHVPPSADTPSGGAGLLPGDRVLARWQTEFFEATVVNVRNTLVTVAWDTPPPEQSHLPRGFVVRRDDTTPPREGEWRLCAGAPAWSVCKVEIATKRSLRVTGLDGQVRSLPVEETLPVPAGLVGWAARVGEARLEQIARKRQFEALVPVTAGQNVRPGDKVIAHWHEGGWWEARVKEIAGSQVVVSWLDGSAPSPVGPSDVAPLSSLPPLASGDLGICRSQKQDTQWFPARVDTVTGGRIAVTYADGTAGDVADGECVAALRGTPMMSP